METIRTEHPLRTITLRYDRSKTAPAFETLALERYREIHDRTWEILQRIQQARQLVPGFNFRIEDIEALFDLAEAKFDHLKVMIPENPMRDTVRGQLKGLLSQIHLAIDALVPDLIAETKSYAEYEDYIVDQEQWMEDVAFPQFDTIFKNYEECAVDMVLFDLDLEDFRHALASVRKQEGRYFDEMGALIDRYSEVNDSIDQFFGQVEEFDRELFDEV